MMTAETAVTGMKIRITPYMEAAEAVARARTDRAGMEETVAKVAS
jgi:hypothetical protein